MEKTDYAWSWEDMEPSVPMTEEERRQAKIEYAREYQKNRYKNDSAYREAQKARMRVAMKEQYNARYGIDMEYTEKQREACRKSYAKKAARRRSDGSN